MISASVIPSLAVRTLMVIVFATVANGQSRYAIRTVNEKIDSFVTATEGCADEIRLIKRVGDDDHKVRWIQTFTIVNNGGELKEGDEVLIERCGRYLRLTSEGELALMEQKDGPALFKIRNLSNDNAGDKDVVFEIKANPGHYLTGGQAKIDARSDCLSCQQNVFKLIKNPQIIDEPICVGEACGELFIDTIEGNIYWTNLGDRYIYIDLGPGRGAPIISPHRRVNLPSDRLGSWYALYKSPYDPQPSSRPQPPGPSSSDVCQGGPGNKITIEAVGDGDLWVRVTNSQTKVASKVVVDGGAVIHYLAAIKKAATSLDLASEIIPNSHVIKVCGKDNLFTLHNARVSVTPF